MECQVCYNIYDLHNHKPHTLYPCSHTLCLVCINDLTTKICPVCRTNIIDNKPNFALIELIPSKSSNRKELDQLVNDLKHLKNQLNQTYTNRLNEINEKSNKIRLSIQTRANQLINEIDLIEDDFIKNLKKIVSYDMYLVENKLREANKDEKINENDLITLKTYFETSCAEMNNKINKINQIEFKNYDFHFGELKKNEVIIKKMLILFKNVNVFVLKDSLDREPSKIISDQQVNNTDKRSSSYFPKWLEELNPKLVISHMSKKVDTLRNSNQFVEAIDLCDKILEIDSTYTDAYISKGSCLKSLKKYTEALDTFNKGLLSIQKGKSNLKYVILSNKALILRYFKRYDQALKCYDEAIEINPENSVVYNDKGNTLFEMNEFLKAIECYTKAISINNTYTDAFINKGICLTKLEKFNEALECYDKSIEIDPNNSLSYKNKGLTYYRMKNYLEAIKSYTKYINLEPNKAEGYNYKGITWYDLKNYAKAIECYDKAIIVDPNYPLSFYNKGLALARLKNYQQAITYFDEAILLKQDYADAYAAKGLALKEVFKMDEANECFQRASQLNLDLTRF